MYEVGDIIFLEGKGLFYPGVSVIVLETENGYVKKAKALIPDPELGKHGFFLEDGEYVIFAYEIIYN